MTNIYEQAAREKKVHRLLEALDAEIGHTATEADADALTEQQLRRVLARANVKSASDTTINALVDCLRARGKR